MNHEKFTILLIFVPFLLGAVEAMDVTFNQIQMSNFHCNEITFTFFVAESLILGGLSRLLVWHFNAKNPVLGFQPGNL